MVFKIRKEKQNCARCQNELGLHKKDPEPAWGFEGKICESCDRYIRNGIAMYKSEYVEGHSQLPSEIKGLLTIHLFDHRNKIIFTAKNNDHRIEISSEELLGYDTVVYDEESTARQILTMGLANSKKEYLKI